MKILSAVLFLFTVQACIHSRAHTAFAVLPAQPEYLLRSPDAKETPFPEVLSHYNSFVPGQGWLELRPRMQLRVENAYYQTGAPKRGLAGYLGTEIARYQVRPNGGLRELSVQSMNGRPSDQPPVQQLIQPYQLHQRCYRFFFEIMFKNANTRGSVLLGAASPKELNQLASQLLSAPDSVCGNQSSHCTVFPEACSVSLEMEIVVNDAPRVIPWTSRLQSVAEHPRHIELLRFYAGRLTPVHVDPSDSNALRLPLLPGDHIRWD